MVQLRTVLLPADNTGVKRLRVFLIHGGSKRKFGYVGDIVSASVIQTSPQSAIKKGEIVKAVIVRTSKETRRTDGSYIRFDDNAAVIIDNLKNKNPRGTRVFGPIAREVKEAGFAKIASLAPEVI
jgi:large subunit ribosomal protein L14